MENEPKEIYLNCWDTEETNPEYNCATNDFDELEGEFINWSPNEIEGLKQIKYVHYSRLSSLEEDNQKLREALDEIMREVIHSGENNTLQGNLNVIYELGVKALNQSKP